MTIADRFIAAAFILVLCCVGYFAADKWFTEYKNQKTIETMLVK